MVIFLSPFIKTIELNIYLINLILHVKIKLSYKDKKGCDAIEETNQKVFAHILDTILNSLHVQNRIHHIPYGFLYKSFKIKIPHVLVGVATFLCLGIFRLFMKIVVGESYLKIVSSYGIKDRATPRSFSVGT